MLSIRASKFLAVSFWLTAGTAWAQVGVPANSRTLPPVPPAAMQFQANQAGNPNAANNVVKLYRLRFASAVVIADELAAVFDRQNVRVASDERLNSVIVASPPAVQDAIAALIPRLDVRSTAVPNGSVTPNSPPLATESVPVVQGRHEVAVRALGGLLSERGALEPGTKITLVKVSPETARALGAFMRPQSAQQADYTRVPVPPMSIVPVLPVTPASPVNPVPPTNPMSPVTPVPSANDSSYEVPVLPGGQVRAFSVSHDQLAGIARALQSISTQDANSGVVLITPPETPVTGSNQGNRGTISR